MQNATFKLKLLKKSVTEPVKRTLLPISSRDFFSRFLRLKRIKSVKANDHYLNTEISEAVKCRGGQERLSECRSLTAYSCLDPYARSVFQAHWMQTERLIYSHFGYL